MRTIVTYVIVMYEIVGEISKHGGSSLHYRDSTVDLLRWRLSPAGPYFSHQPTDWSAKARHIVTATCWKYSHNSNVSIASSQAKITLSPIIQQAYKVGQRETHIPTRLQRCKLFPFCCGEVEKYRCYGSRLSLSCCRTRHC